MALKKCYGQEICYTAAMSIMISEVYDAFLSVGVPDDHARRAAEALSADSSATKSDIQKLDKRLGDCATKADIQTLHKRIDECATKEDIRKLDKRIDGLDKRLDDFATKSDIQKLDKRIDALDKRIDGLDRRIDDCATKSDSQKMDKRIDLIEAELRLIKWMLSFTLAFTLTLWPMVISIMWKLFFSP